MTKIASSRIVAFTLGICLMLAGIFLLTGCGEKEISRISVTTLPQTVYSVGENLNTAGGKFTIYYTDGSKREHDLSLAVANTITFDTAGTKQITVTYGDFSASFEVTVNPADLDFTNMYESTISRIYNGQPQNVAPFANATLPAGVRVTNTEYKLSTAASTEYSTTAPTNAGTYDVRVTIDGGENYNDDAVIAKLVIKKADYASLADGVFDFVGIPSVVYGDDFDLSQCWTTAEGVGAVPLEEEYAQNISYFYTKQGESELTPFTVDESGKVYDKLDAGNYTITVRGAGTENLNAFEVTKTMSVLSKELELGVDYDIVITVSNGTDEPTTIPYVKSTGWINGGIPTVVTISSTDTITVSVVFKGDAAEYCSLSSLEFSYRESLNGADSVTTVLTPRAGYYRVLAHVSCETGNYDVLAFEEEFNAFQVVVE